MQTNQSLPRKRIAESNDQPNAIDLHAAAICAMRQESYGTAARLFTEAAAVAITEGGRTVLLELAHQANEQAKAQTAAAR